ncbi:MAG: hypothetical protein COS41_00575 [Elusimicrobia bacterium CG03_land_8_20_14_0_80_50_18]|nr:MAG: hypothetical protein COS41_00575 [Elusimicrobia bacterium CG03_land_8_20_14_0_80_50_18]
MLNWNLFERHHEPEQLQLQDRQIQIGRMEYLQAPHKYLYQNMFLTKSQQKNKQDLPLLSHPAGHKTLKNMEETKQ